MIKELVDLFNKYGYTWTIGGESKIPDEIEMEAMLDTIAETLYDGSPGDKMTTARLIVEKQARTHDVYVYVGSYQ